MSETKFYLANYAVWHPTDLKTGLTLSLEEMVNWGGEVVSDGLSVLPNRFSRHGLDLRQIQQDSPEASGVGYLKQSFRNEGPGLIKVAHELRQEWRKGKDGRLREKLGSAIAFEFVDDSLDELISLALRIGPRSTQFEISPHTLRFLRSGAFAELFPVRTLQTHPAMVQALEQHFGRSIKPIELRRIVAELNGASLSIHLHSGRPLMLDESGVENKDVINEFSMGNPVIEVTLARTDLKQTTEAARQEIRDFIDEKMESPTYRLLRAFRDAKCTPHAVILGIPRSSFALIDGNDSVEAVQGHQRDLITKLRRIFTY